MRRSIIRGMAALALLLGAGLAVPLVTAEPALAATCTNYGCDGQDPHLTGCDIGAQTVAQAPITWGGTTFGVVYLRWSSTCQTNWALINVYGAASNNPDHLWRAADVYRQNPYAEVHFNYYNAGSWIYGDMLYAPGCAKARGVIDISYATAYGTAYNTGCYF
ncbi:MAG TPA: DUF2690 domain-containing protein [Micromonosporaceae bacterium]|nr:DUF2690 domain-containing protein [Micromonosporaceae bacterium]